MSFHPPRVPTPSEVLAASNKEIPKSLKTTMVALFGIGALIFLIGAVIGSGSRVARVPRELAVLHDAVAALA